MDYGMHVECQPVGEQLSEGTMVVILAGLKMANPELHAVIGSIDEVSETPDGFRFRVTGLMAPTSYKKYLSMEDFVVLPEEMMGPVFDVWVLNKEAALVELRKLDPEVKAKANAPKLSPQEILLAEGIRDAMALVAKVKESGTSLIFTSGMQTEDNQKLYSKMVEQFPEPRLKLYAPKADQGWRLVNFICKMESKLVAGYIKKGKEVAQRTMRIVSGSILNPEEKIDLMILIYDKWIEENPEA